MLSKTEAATARPFFIVFTIVFLLAATATAQEKPSTADYVWGYGGLSLAAAGQVFSKSLAPEQPRWTEPGHFDAAARDAIFWGREDMRTAARISDALLYGVFMPSAVWLPALSPYEYSSAILNQVQVLAATGILTNGVKFLAGRQRPYARFGTAPSRGHNDNLSFFSGHTSLAFALAVSGSMLLEEKYQSESGLIWSGSLVLAGLTGYMRIAADKHYLTDVVAGALTGSLCAWLITQSNQKRFLKLYRQSIVRPFLYIAIPL